MQITPIAHIRSDFPTKFGVPHQSGVADRLQAFVVREPQFRTPEAFRGLEAFSHIWLLWEFSEAKRDSWSPTVRPPRLGGNTRMGVFATRSPFRPNPLGLSSVRLLEVKQDPELGHGLVIAGADLMDGTPFYDIKPYITPDCHPEAVCGFTDQVEKRRLPVDFPEEFLRKVEPEKREALIQVLEGDPRPAYQKDPERIYGMPFAGMDVHFRVQGEVLHVCGIDRYKGPGIK